MARNGRQTGQDAFVLALATGKTVRDAAKEAGLPERTAYRRASSPQVQAEVAECRSKIRSQVVGVATAGMIEAATALRQLLRSKKDSIKLGAAKVLLEAGDKLHNTEQLARKIKELESLLKDDAAAEQSGQAARPSKG